MNFWFSPNLCQIISNNSLNFLAKVASFAINFHECCVAKQNIIVAPGKDSHFINIEYAVKFNHKFLFLNIHKKLFFVS